jgi:hypothetical protein
MKLDRVLADPELTTDRRRRHPGRDRRQDRALAIGEQRRHGRLGSPGTCAGDRRHVEHPAAGGVTKDGDDVDGVRALEHVGVGAGAQRGIDGRPVVAGGQHDHLGLRPALADQLDHLDPGDAGHPEVHQHDVGTPALDQPGQLGARKGLADHLHVVLMLNRAADAGDDQRVIVGDQDLQPKRRCGVRLAAGLVGDCAHVWSPCSATALMCGLQIHAGRHRPLPDTYLLGARERLLEPRVAGGRTGPQHQAKPLPRGRCESLRVQPPAPRMHPTTETAPDITAGRR